METTYNLNAIVLHRVPWREKDSRATLYSLENGKIELIVRGTKSSNSKLVSMIEPLNLINLMGIAGRRHDYLGGAIIENAYQPIKSDFKKIYYSGKGVNIFNQTVKSGLADANLFFLLKSFLDALEESREGDLIFHSFILKFLNMLGYAPTLKNCSACGAILKIQNNFFDFKGGGVVCPPCAKKKKIYLTISPDCVKVLKFIQDNNFEKIIRLKISSELKKETFNIINKFVLYKLEIKI